MEAAKRPAKSKRDGDVRDYETENGVVRRRIQTLSEMLETIDSRIAERKASMQRTEKALLHLNDEFNAESAKTEPEYLELRQQYADMKTNYKKILENMCERIANAKRDNGLLEKELVALELQKDQLIRSKKAAMQRLEHQMEEMALEFSQMLMEAADRMTESVTVSYSAWESGHGKPPLLSRLQELP